MLITATDIYTYLNQVAVNAANTTLMTAIANRASDIVTQAVGFGFDGYTAGSKDVRADPTRSQYLRLPAYNLGSVTTVVMVMNRGQEIESTRSISDWIEEPKFYLYRDHWWERGAWYRIQAEWGYGDPPPALTQLALELAVNIWRSKEKGLFTEIMGAEGAGAVRYIGGLNSLQRQIVDSVRRQYIDAVH